MGPIVDQSTKLVPTAQLRQSYPLLALACDYELPYSTVLLVADALPKLVAGGGNASGDVLNLHELGAMDSLRAWPGKKRDELFTEIEKVHARAHP